MKIIDLFLIIFLLSLYSCNNTVNNSNKINSNPLPSPVAEETAKSRIPLTVRKLTDDEIKDSTKAFFNLLKKQKDDFENITWYQPKSFTHYNNSNMLSVYMGVENNYPFLRLKMSYEGDDWIFFETAMLNYDGKTLDIPFNNYDNKKSDHDAGIVWEWIDVGLDSAMINYLEQFAKSNSAKMRLSGKYTKDRSISKIEKREILNVINAYNKLKYYNKLIIDK